eukprot:gene16996-23065_t
MARVLADSGLGLNGFAMRYYSDPAFKLGAFTHPDATVRRKALDLTKAGLDALREAGGNFRQLFERSEDAIVLIEGSTILDANPAALALFHCGSKDELVGKTLVDFSPANQPSGELSALADAAQAAQNFIEGNRRYE